MEVSPALASNFNRLNNNFAMIFQIQLNDSIINKFSHLNFQKFRQNVYYFECFAYTLSMRAKHSISFASTYKFFIIGLLTICSVSIWNRFQSIGADNSLMIIFWESSLTSVDVIQFQFARVSASSYGIHQDWKSPMYQIRAFPVTKVNFAGPSFSVLMADF